MGLFDTVMVPCPFCGKKHEFQSKSGDCMLQFYELENCPEDVLININRHSPYECDDCRTLFEVNKQTKKSIISIIK